MDYNVEFPKCDQNFSSLSHANKYYGGKQKDFILFPKKGYADKEDIGEQKTLMSDFLEWRPSLHNQCFLYVHSIYRCSLAAYSAADVQGTLEQKISS